MLEEVLGSIVLVVDAAGVVAEVAVPKARVAYFTGALALLPKESVLCFEAVAAAADYLFALIDQTVSRLFIT